MKFTMSALLATASLIGAPFAGAECVYPEAKPEIPDGSNATEEQMVEAMQALKQYDSDVTAYLSCLELETQARIEEGGEELTEEQANQLRAIQVKKHNAAVEALEAQATEFNEQVRKFKEKQKS